VIDHSVQVDYFGSADAYEKNVKLEYERNGERYRALKWAQQAFDDFRVVPPGTGTGIVHQVNLEYLGQVVHARERDGEQWLLPDTLVGTDSHTPMIGGIGVVGWGRGIEAEAAMLGQPITMKLPEVVGVRLTGELPEGATATDLVLHVTEQLREVGVVDRFVEFFGPGVSNLTVPDRATIANMAPEQGSTISMFGVDEATLDYLELTGRDEEHIELVREYFDAQGLFGEQNPEYSETVEFDLSTITPSLAGPKKPQDRVAMGDMKTHFRGLVHGEFEEELDDIDEEAITRWLGESSASDDRPDPDLPEPDVGDLDKRVAVDVNSEGRSPSGSLAEPGDGETTEIGHGSVVVSAITSCTNTSNPSVMIAAGLLARNAVERGLDVPAYVKTSLAPGSRVVTEYLEASGFSRTSKTSATTSSATAVRPVSGTPARFPSRSNVRSTPRILDHERPFGEPQLRGSHPPEDSCELPRQPAARRRLWPRRADGHRPRTRPARNGCRRRSGLSRGHLARRRRDPRGGSRQCRFLDVRREVRLRVRGRRTLDGTRCADR